MTDGLNLNPQNLLSPSGEPGMLMAYPGMTQSNLLVAGIIDLIPFSFGIGGIITYSKCPPDHPGKANWKKFALLQTLTLIFLFWTGLPFMLHYVCAIIQILIGIDNQLMAACETEELLNAYIANYSPVKQGLAAAAGSKDAAAASYSATEEPAQAVPIATAVVVAGAPPTAAEIAV